MAQHTAAQQRRRAVAPKLARASATTAGLRLAAEDERDSLPVHLDVELRQKADDDARSRVCR